MKLCSRIRVVNGAPCDIVDLSLVEDDHEYGLKEDKDVGWVLHSPGLAIDGRLQGTDE